MAIELKTLDISADSSELEDLHTLLEKETLSVPSGTNGALSVKRLFTSQGQKVVFQCEFSISIGRDRSVCSSRNSTTPEDAARKAHTHALEQLDYLNQLSRAS